MAVGRIFTAVYLELMQFNARLLERNVKIDQTQNHAHCQKAWLMATILIITATVISEIPSYNPD